MKRSSFVFRIRLVSFFVFIISLGLITRLFFIQVIEGEARQKEADRQYFTSSSSVFNRGSIFFNQKDNSLVAAATVSSGYKLAINPQKVSNAEELYQVISEIIDLQIDKETFIARATKKNDPYEEVAHNLTKEQADNIRSLKISSISVFRDNWRFYPGESLAAHTIGFLAYKENNIVGQYGLERYYENVLTRQEEESFTNLFAEIFLSMKDKDNETDRKQGDLVTTIDSQVQQFLEIETLNFFNKWNAEIAGGIIMNPQTGEIYAMAGIPNFDLNNFRKVENVGVYRNQLVESVFEFGSVIKPLVVATGIDLDVITPETNYYDSGSIVVDKKEIKNFDKKGRGQVTVQDILNQSLNTGMVFIEDKIGHDDFRKYMKSFAIGERTGIDLPNETFGLIKNLDSPRNIEYANASFGQGIALTPIGAIRAFSIIANGGNLIRPHIVKQIRYEDGTSEVIQNEVIAENLITKETSETVTRMLVKVFESYNAGAHKMEHYSVATKTGTAQVAMENGRGYYEDKHLHSFFGYFPAYNPRFIVFLFVKDPKGIRYASQTLIPPFESITKFLLNYYNVPPDR